MIAYGSRMVYGVKDAYSDGFTISTANVQAVSSVGFPKSPKTA